MLENILVIIVTGVIIYFAGTRFVVASCAIGDYLKLPRSVKGATLDAISSSFPELMVAIISILRFGKFELGIGTIVGSAFFNLLVIPSASILIAPVAFKVSKEVIYRDGLYYTLSVVLLLASLIYSNTWNYMIPIIFLLVYMLYFRHLLTHTKAHRAKLKASKQDISIKKEVSISLIAMSVIGVSAFFLADHAIQFSSALGISPLIIGFTAVAIATSLPDAVISFGSARKGSINDSVSNVFGSNIFNILVVLSIPLLLAIILWGPVKIIFDQIEIVVALLVSTILVVYFFSTGRTLSKREASAMLAMYLLFTVYVIWLPFT